MKTEELKMVTAWDKTFPKSEKVDHKKTTFANKELLTIPDAVHTDLYDNLDVIPFNKMQKFFEENGVC